MYQICVSGGAKGESVEAGRQLATQLGKVLAGAGLALMTGATSGLPDFTAAAYKKAGGMVSLGISPAATKVEHVFKYRLPTAHYDMILYTGLHYVGRDALLINSADAVISIGGRLGTLHEFAIALETHTPIGLLQGAGGISTQLESLSAAIPNASRELVLFEADAKVLVEKITKLLDKLHRPYRSLYT